MQYTPELLKQHLGRKYEPDADYVIDTHNGAVGRTLDSHWARVGEVPDSAPGEGGTMVVFKRVISGSPRLKGLFGGKK